MLIQTFSCCIQPSVYQWHISPNSIFIFLNKTKYIYSNSLLLDFYRAVKMKGRSKRLVYMQRMFVYQRKKWSSWWLISQSARTSLTSFSKERVCNLLSDSICVDFETTAACFFLEKQCKKEQIFPENEMPDVSKVLLMQTGTGAISSWLDCPLAWECAWGKYYGTNIKHNFKKT